MQYAPGLLYFSECVCMLCYADDANINTNTNYNISFNTNTMFAGSRDHGPPADIKKTILTIFKWGHAFQQQAQQQPCGKTQQDRQ